MAKLTRDELLILLIEECGEVVQAATKCLRFGYDSFKADYGRNDLVLSRELGDLLAVVEELSARGDLDSARIREYGRDKIIRANNAKEKFGVRPEQSSGD